MQYGLCLRIVYVYVYMWHSVGVMYEILCVWYVCVYVRMYISMFMYYVCAVTHL